MTVIVEREVRIVLRLEAQVMADADRAFSDLGKMLDRILPEHKLGGLRILKREIRAGGFAREGVGA